MTGHEGSGPVSSILLKLHDRSWSRLFGFGQNNRTEPDFQRLLVSYILPMFTQAFPAASGAVSGITPLWLVSLLVLSVPSVGAPTVKITTVLLHLVARITL